MAPDRSQRPIRVRAHAKLNLTLRILGRRVDGYHDLRTTLQSLALYDTLTLVSTSGPFEIDCDDPDCPRDRSNLVWKAAEALWHSLGRRGAVSGLRIRITKRIPIQAGLGGGSSDAAAALRALAIAWDAQHAAGGLRALGRGLGADVPFFFKGGTALGLERGDLIFTLPDCRTSWVVLVVPSFGVSARDAYAWWDAASDSGRRGTLGPRFDGEVPPSIPIRRASLSGRLTDRGPTSDVQHRLLELPATEWVNDLEDPVVAHHPEVGRLVRRLRRAGAGYAAMSGSGSAVFGIFGTGRNAAAAANALRRSGLRVLVTRTVGRGPYQRLSEPRVA